METSTSLSLVGLAVTACIMLITYFVWRVRPVGQCDKCGGKLTATSYWKTDLNIYGWTYLLGGGSAWREWLHRCECQMITAAELPLEMQRIAQQNARKLRKFMIILHACMLLLILWLGLVSFR